VKSVVKQALQLVPRKRFLPLLVMGWILCAAPLSAADAATPGAKPAFTAEQVTALETLRRELARLDPMLEKVTEPDHKAWVKSKVEKLKARFQELEKTAFDQTKFDELRFDLNIEYQRLAVWLRPAAIPARSKAK
jgi:hypothetical protein